MSLLKHFCLSLIVPVHVCTGNYIVITCHNITVSSQVTTCTCIYNYIKVNLHVYTYTDQLTYSHALHRLTCDNGH